MNASDFDQAVTTFLHPLESHLRAATPTCLVHWLELDPGRAAPEAFALPGEEILNYVRGFLEEGFFATVRATVEGSQNLLHVALWEEWEGTGLVRWPVTTGEVVAEWIWGGYGSVAA